MSRSRQISYARRTDLSKSTWQATSTDARAPALTPIKFISCSRYFSERYLSTPTSQKKNTPPPATPRIGRSSIGNSGVLDAGMSSSSDELIVSGVSGTFGMFSSRGKTACPGSTPGNHLPEFVCRIPARESVGGRSPPRFILLDDSAACILVFM